jgi:release factor glutamine methyltransferase
MIYRDLLRLATQRLDKQGVRASQLDAEALLTYVTNRRIEFLLTHLDDSAGSSIVRRYTDLVSRRLKHEPIAYLIRSANFCAEKLMVNQHTLIPRPETEQLVDLSVDLINKYKINQVLELGTGSGAIAVTLARLIPKLHMYASDISPEAIRVARSNAISSKVLSRLTLRCGSLMEPWPNLKIGLLVANLPYVSREELKSSPSKAELKYEPRQALYGGKDGLDIYSDMFKQVARLEYLPKIILIEFGWKQSVSLKAIVKTLLPQYHIVFIRDYRKILRFMILKIK